MFDRSLLVFLIDKGKIVLITTGVDCSSLLFLHFQDLKPKSKISVSRGALFVVPLWEKNAH
jgi:hypothetical protein